MPCNKILAIILYNKCAFVSSRLLSLSYLSLNYGSYVIDRFGDCTMKTNSWDNFYLLSMEPTISVFRVTINHNWQELSLLYAGE